MSREEGEGEHRGRVPRFFITENRKRQRMSVEYNVFVSLSPQTPQVKGVETLLSPRETLDTYGDHVCMPIYGQSPPPPLT